MKHIQLFIITLLVVGCTNGVQQPTEEWQRTNPDVIVYIPEKENDGDNEHFLVFESPVGSELFAIWTQSSVEGHGDNRIAFARSKDGENWSKPIIIAGKSDDRDDEQASWAFPIVSSKGRIYCFYTKEVEKPDLRQSSGVLGCYYSDDNGYIWTKGKDIDFHRNKFDNQDKSFTPNWIVWQKPVRDQTGKYITGYTQWTSETIVPLPSKVWTDRDSRSAFMRFENIDENPLPEDIIITWLPFDCEGLEVPHKTYPDISVCQEPSIAILPDGRLFCTMRTMTGYIWYSVSEDNGNTWRIPEVLRYKDQGDMIPQPMASCPVYRLSNGKYLLIYFNNHGIRGEYNQFTDQWGSSAHFLRNPAHIALGEFKPDAYQPIWFSQPMVLLDTNDIPIGPKGTAEVATYPSITEKDGKRTLWYPDRKHFLLGKYLPDKLLNKIIMP